MKEFIIALLGFYAAYLILYLGGHLSDSSLIKECEKDLPRSEKCVYIAVQEKEIKE